MITLLYEILFWTAFVLSSPYYLLRMKRRGGYARGFLERFGCFSRTKADRLRNLRPVWIHAVSVGEVDLALQLIEKLRSRPRVPPLLLSTTTSTGHALAARKLPPDIPVIYYPVDSRLCFGRVHRLTAPVALLLVEAELWPNHLRFCRKRRIPMALINARLSERCYPGYRRFRWFFEKAFQGFRVVTLQSTEDSKRLSELGFPAASLQVVGSLKYDTAQGVDAERRERLRKDLAVPNDRAVWVAGSTHPGEEEIAADIFVRLRSTRPNLALVLAPRHAERAEEIVRMLQQRGLVGVRRSCLASEAAASWDVLVLDTTGELKCLYEHATVIFMGKSLTGHGGQNIVEPAAWGRPMIFGPHMENFTRIAADFIEAGAAVQVQDPAGLEKEMAGLLDDAARREALGTKARQVIERQRGAMDRTMAAIGRMLDTVNPTRSPP